MRSRSEDAKSVRGLLQREADKARAPSSFLSVPIEIASDPGSSVVATGFPRPVLDVLPGVSRGEGREALSSCRNRIECLHEWRDQFLMRLHVDHTGRRQSTSGLKVAYPLLGRRAKVAVDRDGEAI
jgi:hypothetical protein